MLLTQHPQINWIHPSTIPINTYLIQLPSYVFLTGPTNLYCFALVLYPPIYKIYIYIYSVQRQERTVIYTWAARPIYEQEKSSNNQHRKRLLIRNKTEQNAYLLKAVQDYRQFHAEHLYMFNMMRVKVCFCLWYCMLCRHWFDPMISQSELLVSCSSEGWILICFLLFLCVFSHVRICSFFFGAIVFVYSCIKIMTCVYLYTWAKCNLSIWKLFHLKKNKIS